MELDETFSKERDSFGSEPEDLEEIFSNLDRSGSGFIEKSDFENLCQNLELDGEEVEAVFRELDKDGDRRISLHEFTDGLKHVELFVRQRATSTPAAMGLAERTSSPVTREAWGLFSHRSGRDLFLLPR
ncbi:RASEF [Branchiostoma lanceolatum]|uniref:RASEF protein n=1 Tax=Branchiostoma lanceolatum TaxID=7740 RepID=A0A8K0EG15_BRALA|nr:RASEF [Branchiostoma lanceolatum]